MFQLRINAAQHIHIRQYPARHGEFLLNRRLHFLGAHPLIRGNGGIVQQGIENPGGQPFLVLLLQKLLPHQHIDQQLQFESIVDLKEIDGRLPRLIVENQEVGIFLMYIQTVNLPLQGQGKTIAQGQRRQLYPVKGMAKTFLKVGRLEFRHGRPGREMIHRLQGRSLHAPLVMAVIGTAQQNFTLQTGRNLLHQIMANLPPLFLRHILPAAVIILSHHFPILTDDLMQELAQIHLPEFIGMAFLQFQAIAGKMGKGTAAELLELGDTAPQEFAPQKDGLRKFCWNLPYGSFG